MFLTCISEMMYHCCVPGMLNSVCSGISVYSFVGSLRRLVPISYVVKRSDAVNRIVLQSFRCSSSLSRFCAFSLMIHVLVCTLSIDCCHGIDSYDSECK